MELWSRAILHSGSTSGKAVKRRVIALLLLLFVLLENFPLSISLTPISDILQVAITLVYRYQPPAGAPIDAGKLVADNGKIGGYRY